MSDKKAKEKDHKEKEHKEKDHKEKDHKDKDKKEKEAKQEKVETFNSLDIRFQLKPEHDDNYIFPEELELIQELRRRRPELEKETDKFLCVFLFARRHNLDDTVELLDKYNKKKKELGFDVNPPSLKDELLKKHIEQGMILKQKFAVDNHNRLVHYIYVAKDKPKERPITTLYAYGFWEAEYQIKTETLRTWRDGSTFVVDFKGFGLSNIDLSPKGIEYSKALSGLFPKRIRKVYLLNGGWLLKLISEGAKLVLSKKLCERVEMTTQEGLKNYIPEQWLLTEYGGKCTFTSADWVESALKDEERWAKEESEKKEGKSSSDTDSQRKVSDDDISDDIISDDKEEDVEDKLK